MANYCEHCGSVIDEEAVERKFGDLILSPSKVQLTCNDISMRLAPKEGEIVTDLISAKNHYVSYDALMLRHFAELDQDPIAVYVSHLRAKFRQLGTKVTIETVYGTGIELRYEPNQRFITFEDLTLDMQMSIVFTGEAKFQIKTMTAKILRELMTSSFVPIEETVKKLATGVHAEKAFRQHITYARRALSLVGSKVTIQTSLSRDIEGAVPGYWLKGSKFVGPAHELTVVMNGRQRILKPALTQRQQELLDIWSEHPLDSYVELGKRMSPPIEASCAFRIAKEVRNKGFAKDITLKQRAFKLRGLTKKQAELWSLIKGSPNRTTEFYAEKLGSSSSATWHMIDKLEAKGAIKKTWHGKSSITAVEPPGIDNTEAGQ